MRVWKSKTGTDRQIGWVGNAIRIVIHRWDLLIQNFFVTEFRKFNENIKEKLNCHTIFTAFKPLANKQHIISNLLEIEEFLAGFAE